MLSHDIKKILDAAIPPPDFEFDSDNGGILSKGYGQMPASIRSTTKTIITFEGILATCKIGEISLDGYRRDENIITASENYADESWVTSSSGTGSLPIITPNYGIAPNGTMTADRVQFNKGGGTTQSDYSLVQQTVITLTEQSNSIYLKTTDGSVKTIWLRLGVNTKAITISGSWTRYSNPGALALFGIGLRGGLTPVNDNIADILVFGAHISNTKEKTNKNPPEYKSTGVLSYPYHGFGANGVWYSKYQNGNTVVSNVVTEAQGPLIPETTRKGFTANVQRKNLIIQSQALSTWTAIETPTITSANKNYGTLVLDLVGDDDASGLEGYKRSLTFTGDTQKSVSFFVKIGTSTKSVIKIADTTATADRLNIEVTWSGSVPVLNFLTGSQEKPAEDLYDGVYRIFCLTSSVAAANTNEIQVYPATDGTLAVGATGNVNIGGFQAEDALFAGPYIPTTTTTVTINADVLYYPSVSNITSFQGTISVEFAINTSTAFTGFIWASQADSNNYVALLFDGTSLIARKRVGGTNYDATIAFSYVSGTKYKAAMCWGDEGVKVALNGTLGTAHTNNATPSIGTNFYIGSDGAGANQCCGAIRRLQSRRRQLTSRQLMELTL